MMMTMMVLFSLFSVILLLCSGYVSYDDINLGDCGISS